MQKFLLTIMVVLALGSVYSWRYHSLLKKVEADRQYSDQLPKDNPAAALLTHEQYLALGWVEPETRNLSFYPNHPMRKPPGVIRIGIFGGSMAICGGRTDKRDFTYPGLLQEKFKEQGLGRVEVINFGGNAYGFSQEYMLWEFLGRKYDLDYVIFTLQDNVKIRDDVFNNYGNHLGQSPLHGRYIMDHGDLRFIPVAGDSRQKAIKLYQSIIPPLRYLLYEKYMPFSLKVFLPRSLHARRNPFYYRHDRDEYEENYAIYAALLEKAARQVKHVIIVANQPDSKEILKRIKSPNVRVFTLSYGNIIDQLFYHYDGGQHIGPLGNALVADGFFSYLTGRDKWEDASLQVKPCPRSSRTQGEGITGELSDYDHWQVQAGDKKVAKMVYLNGEKFSKIKSFLMLCSGESQFVQFLLLPFDLKEGQKVFLSLPARSLFVGTVHAFNKTVGQLELTQGKLFVRAYWGLNNVKTFLTFDDRDTFEIRIKDMAYLIPDKEDFFDGDPFNPKGGTVDFVVTKKDGEQQRCPILSYQFVPFDEPILDPYQELMQELSRRK